MSNKALYIKIYYDLDLIWYRYSDYDKLNEVAGITEKLKEEGTSPYWIALLMTRCPPEANTRSAS
jgi:hypothetical protein